jgi:hypothetical protein
MRGLLEAESGGNLYQAVEPIKAMLSIAEKMKTRALRFPFMAVCLRELHLRSPGSGHPSTR